MHLQGILARAFASLHIPKLDSPSENFPSSHFRGQPLESYGGASECDIRHPPPWMLKAYWMENWALCGTLELEPEASPGSWAHAELRRTSTKASSTVHATVKSSSTTRHRVFMLFLAVLLGLARTSSPPRTYWATLQLGMSSELALCSVPHIVGTIWYTFIS